jgi:hypothetical protein
VGLAEEQELPEAEAAARPETTSGQTVPPQEAMQQTRASRQVIVSAASRAVVLQPVKAVLVQGSVEERPIPAAAAAVAAAFTERLPWLIFSWVLAEVVAVTQMRGQAMVWMALTAAELFLLLRTLFQIAGPYVLMVETD